MSNISVSIMIPTLKKPKEVQKQIDDIMMFRPAMECEVKASCIEQSAAKNRNWCIDNAKGDIIIQTDDDCTGYFSGWAEILINALIENPDFSIVSARPLHIDGSYCPILGDCGSSEIIGEYQKCIHTKETQLNICGSATIAFWKNSNVRFDENYLGCTYEDSDFCMQMNKEFPDKKIVFANQCNIIHNEERKGRDSGDGKRGYWRHNCDYFAKKWGVKI